MKARWMAGVTHGRRVAFWARGHDGITQMFDGSWATIVKRRHRRYRTLYGAKAAAEAERQRRCAERDAWARMWGHS